MPDAPAAPPQQTTPSEPALDPGAVDRAYALTDRVLEECPRRLAGTESCRRAAEIIRGRFAAHCGPEGAVVETFRFHPTAFLKFVRPAILLVYISLALVWLDLAWIALVVAPLTTIGFLTQVAFYRGTFDPLFPAATGANALGRLEPPGPVRQQIIVSGHHDAAYVFHTLDRFPRFYPFALVGTLVMDLLAMGLAIALLVDPGLLAMARWVIPVAVVLWRPFMLGHWFMTADAVSPGAGDNMMSVAIVDEVGRAVAEARRSGAPLLEHTRLVLASFDGEESALKGARAYCEQHAAELADPAVPTRVLNLESLFRLDQLCLQSSDINGFVPLSGTMNDELLRIAHAQGLDHVTTRAMAFLGGGTDAGEFARRGVEATTVLGIIPDASSLTMDTVYHSPRDTSDRVDRAAVEATLRLVLAYLVEKDEALRG